MFKNTEFHRFPIVFLLILTILAGCSSASDTTRDRSAEGDFPPPVAAAIRDSLGDPQSNLAKEDLEKVEGIQLEGIAEPIDLSSLKKLVNLKSLTLSYTNAENLDFLGEIPHLEYLQLEGVGLEQLPDFGKLRLKSVNINDSDIESLDFIKNWDALEYLSLSNARLSSLEGIQQAKNLEGLLISNNPVNDISLLKELDVLERLELRSTRVTDLSPLAALEDLKLLDIRDTDVRRVAPVANLPKLKILLVTKKNIDDLPKVPDTVEVSETNVLAY